MTATWRGGRKEDVEEGGYRSTSSPHDLDSQNFPGHEARTEASESSADEGRKRGDWGGKKTREIGVEKVL